MRINFPKSRRGLSYVSSAKTFYAARDFEATLKKSNYTIVISTNCVVARGNGRIARNLAFPLSRHPSLCCCFRACNYHGAERREIERENVDPRCALTYDSPLNAASSVRLREARIQ